MAATPCASPALGAGRSCWQQLALLKGFDFKDAIHQREFVHRLSSAQARLRRREKFYGDPDFAEVPMATLLSDAYNDARRKLVTDQASLEQRRARSKGFGAVVKLPARTPARHAVGGMGAGEPTVGSVGEVRGDTVHFDIVDQAGNMVSATPSGGWLQSSPVIPSSAFVSERGRQMFWLEEGHPAALAPGKRRAPRSAHARAARRRSVHGWGSPAATSRINGPRSCSCATSMPG